MTVTTMLNRLSAIAKSKTYWLGLMLLGLALEVTALVYQYVWDELPCVACIHVRLWIACFILVALAGLIVRHNRYLLTTPHAVNTVIMAGLLERSWLLLGTERGTVIASCTFDLDLPSWLAFDKWAPALFEVQALCGYTPEVLFGITMAEGLTALSASLLLASIVLTIASWVRQP